MPVRKTILCFLLLTAAPALAGPYYVEPTVGYGWYRMSTVNNFVDGLEAGLDHLEGGAGLGVALGRKFENGWATSFAYERWFSKLEATAGDEYLEINCPANVLRFQATWTAVRFGKAEILVQGAAGFFRTSGHVIYRDASESVDRRHDFEGSKVMAEFLAGVGFDVSERIGVNLLAGYRLADLNNPKWENESWGGYGYSTGPGFDYTGAVVRAGVRIRLNWGSGDASDRDVEPAYPNRQM